MVQLDPSTQRILQRALQDAFPDAHISQQDVEALALALHRGLADPGTEGPLPAALQNLDFSQCASELEALAQSQPLEHASVARAADDGVRYYWAEATHTRKHPAGFQPFVGKLPMVRVSFPATQPRLFETAIGTVEPQDHLIATVYEANDKFAKTLGYQLARVDAITPPRQELRFGAVSVMLGYRDAAGDPCCYILEAGTATGQPKVLYLGKTLASTINQYSGYRPTPFACSDNAYTGALTLFGDSPAQLHITARKILNGVSQPAYMDLRVEFMEQTGTIQNIWSGLLIARAVSIVLARRWKGIPDGCEKRELPE